MRASFILAALCMVCIAGCSNNVHATDACEDAGSSNSCINCCHDNGALGYSWTGGGSCKCLN